MKEVHLLYGATMPGVQFLCSDLLWKTAFQAPDPFFFCEFTGGKSVMLASVLEYERARKEAKNCEVVLLRPFIDKAGSNSQLDGLVVFLNEHKVRRIILPNSMPSGVEVRMRNSGFSVEVQDAGMSWYPERLVKSPEEIECIAEIQKKMESILSAVVRLLRRAVIADDGILVDKRGKIITAESVRDFIEIEFAKKGCLATNTIIACGDQAVDPHCRGFGPLRAYLPIVMDIFPRSKKNWYWTDMSRTFFKGKPSKEARKMYNSVLDAQRLAMGMIRAGVDGSAIQKAVSEFFVKNGYSTGAKDGVMQGFIHSVGHGVGIDIHEMPFIAPLPSILPERCAVTVEPGLYYLGVGGVRIEDLVVVEKEGIRNLTSFPKELKDMIIP